MHPTSTAARLLTRLLGLVCVTLMTLAAPALADAPPPAGAHHLAMRLVAESGTPRAGATVAVAIDTRPQPGWHGYWRNPGDAGFPSTFKWTLPAGASASDFQWPVPTTLLISGLMNYVYEAPYAPIASLSIPAGLAPGTRLPVRLHASYLVCTASLCVPEDADLSLDLTVGDGTPDHRTEFDGWRRALPRPLGAQAVYQFKGGYNAFDLAIPYPAGAPGHDFLFLPYAAGAVDYAAGQSVIRRGDTLTILAKAAASPTEGPIAGVLATGDGRGLIVQAKPGLVNTHFPAPTPTVATGILGDALAAFGLAVLGGLILNVMPCVFPILSLKALSLARSGASARHARAEALAYTAGVVAVCVGLGAIILALKAGGATVGWAFQLQNPAVVLVLALLTAGIAFNLAGLFELPTPPVGAGGSSAFATGALAAVIATPCTGPFMGAALGAALVLPWYAAIAVFAGLGIGLALPFLLIGFVPALRSRLPRPGAWMETTRRVLSVPMFLTAIALGWVLGRQAGSDGLSIALLGVLGVALLLWLAGLRQARGRSFGWVNAVLIVAVAALAAAQVGHARRPAQAVAAAGEEQPFTEARLAQLRAAGRPVFAYFTADWCLTCKVNERGAIADAGVHAAFAREKVATLVGDWTDGDPVLGRFIQAHNRAGVPLYLYYAPGAAEPRVLPQVLTPATLEGLAS